MKPSSTRGYTMMEVMAALGILTVGASGVIALQKITLLSNAQSKNVSTANAIAATWVERLRTDALQWNSSSDLNDTAWIKNVSTNAGVWFVPSEISGYASPDADVLGADIFGTDPALPAYCVHIRLSQLYPTMVRAEIRVLWTRSNGTIDCTMDPNTVATDTTTYGSVYIATGITQTPLQ